MAKQNESSESGIKPSRSQRAVGYVSVVLVALLLGYLFYSAVFKFDTQPDIVLTVQQVESNGDDYLVRFSAMNKGGKTAANVKVKAGLFINSQEVEQASVTLQYLPSKSHAEGGFYFQRDPGQGDLRLRVKNYRRP